MTHRYEGNDHCAEFANAVLDWCDEMGAHYGVTDRLLAKYKRLASAAASGDIEDAIAAAIDLDDFEEHELRDECAGGWLVAVECLFEIRQVSDAVA